MNSDKYKELLKFSNPEKVIENAIYFYGPDVNIDVSTRKDKKYMIYDRVNNKMVHFGQMGYQDFTKHKNKKRQALYLARATRIKGNWRENPFSPNNLSIKIK